MVLLRNTEAAMMELSEEQRRLDALRRSNLLHTPPEAPFEAAAQLASSLCGVPIALVSLVDESQQWFKANLGFEGISCTDRDVAFCSHAIERNEFLEIRDTYEDPRFANNPLVLGDPFIRFYAGMPLRFDRLPIGTLCVIDRVPRRLTKDQRIHLRLIAAMLEGIISAGATPRIP